MRLAVAGLTVAVLAASAADAEAARLRAFDSCRDLVGYARDGALRTNGGAIVTGRAVPPPAIRITTPPLTPPGPVEIRGVAPPAPQSGESLGGAVPEFSGTNTQEIDVDEPDVIKTDGRRIVAVTDGTLRVIAPGGGVTGTLALDGLDHRLLLRGDRVLVIASKGATAPELAAQMASTTLVTEVDLSGAPRVTRTMEVPGRFVDARQNGATARLVIDAMPRPIVPARGETLDDAVGEAGMRRFLGRTVLKSHLSGKTFRRPLAPCDAVTHPRRFSGLDVLAILTVDLDRGMYSLDRDGVMAGAQVVYGSSGSLYVASHRFVRSVETGGQVPDGMRTEIHRFDISDPAKTVYRATGSVPGFILNNYALSEHEGALRVASTEVAPWMGGGGSSSRVTVLRQDGSRLVEVGAVGGLGQGERIFGVRFIGERGYVVTFRQVDPLYTLDLSRPAAPRVVGELKIPGYSAYLHPVGETQLLGVGREGAAVKTSLFDVANLAAPREAAQLRFDNSWTAVEQEPHAFLYWRNLAVMPLSGPSFLGAVGIRVAPNALGEAGRIVHHSAERRQDAEIVRNLVIGNTLYSLSWLGLSASRLDTLATTSYTAF
jgi:uncharacterized secreted protein with C-terminal beta-propeller domain